MTENSSFLVSEGDEGGEGRSRDPAGSRRESPLTKPELGILPISPSSFLTDYKLTGWGMEKANCGTYFIVGCLNVEKHRGMNLDGVNMEGKAVLEVHRNTCHRPLCPVCWESWANREVKRAIRRLQSFGIKGRNLKPIHVTVSVPLDDWELPLESMRRKVYGVLKRVHCLGGMLIFHPKRQRNDKSWYFSPHFHIVGYGWIMDVRANYVHSGYIVKNIGIRKTLEGTIFYQLSHCGHASGHHTVTWFGALSYGRMHLPKIVEEKPTCPLCGNRFHRVGWIGKGECPLPDVEGVTFYDDPCNWYLIPPKWSLETTL